MNLFGMHYKYNTSLITQDGDRIWVVVRDECRIVPK